MTAAIESAMDGAPGPGYLRGFLFMHPIESTGPVEVAERVRLPGSTRCIDPRAAAQVVHRPPPQP